MAYKGELESPGLGMEHWGDPSEELKGDAGTCSRCCLAYTVQAGAQGT